MSQKIRQPYNGPYRKLALAFDVGTTFSGISYCIMDPGEVPEIKGVTRFPAQELVGGDSKIPTVLYYDKRGIVRAAGAEASRDGIEVTAEEEGWVKAEWFKLHLRPKTRSAAYVTNEIPALPNNKSVVDVFADFLKYLFQCARTYITETHANGPELWKSLEQRIEFVLTHPNGWEGAQQGQMRRAAVIAGLIPDNDDGQSRISFVTEGEASLHFCIRNGLTTEAMKKGKGVIIVDAGGGTVDISTYRQANSSFEEMSAPLCYFKGSIFVTQNADAYLKRLLGASRFKDDIPNMTRMFDKTTKLRFRDRDEPQYIKFGSARDKDPQLNIRSGQLKVSGLEVASFFEPSVDCIIQAIKQQQVLTQNSLSSVFLVGGFAASDWLFSRLKEALTPLNLDVCRPDSHVNKAVADGAVSFHLDHFVGARISKFAYGVTCNVTFDGTDVEHLRRINQTYVSLSGVRRLRGCFDVILPKNTKVSETKEYRNHYFRESPSISALQEFTTEVSSYRGQIEKPKYKDIDSQRYSTMCTIQANIPGQLSKKKRGNDGSEYFVQEFDVILLFGLTELRAQICWKNNGAENRSPATIIYDSETNLAD